MYRVRSRWILYNKTIDTMDLSQKAFGLSNAIWTFRSSKTLESLMTWGSSKSIDQMMRVIVRNWQSSHGQSIRVVIFLQEKTRQLLNQSHKNSKLFGQQNITRKNSRTEALSESAKIVFATKIRQKCVNKICNINVPKVQTWDVYHGTYSKNLLTLSGNFLRLSEYFPDCPETFQTLLKLSRLSKNFPEYPETFQTVCYI